MDQARQHDRPLPIRVAGQTHADNLLQPGDRCCPQSLRRRPVTDLTEVVASPAVAYAIRGLGACMVGAGPNLLEGEPTRDRHRRPPEDRRAVTELAIPVGSPAVDPVPAGLAARMAEPRAQPAEDEAAGYRARHETLLPRPITDLAFAPVAPAEGLVGHCAAMVLSCGHLGEEMPPHHESRPQAIGLRPVAELAGAVVTPAVGLIVG